MRRVLVFVAAVVSGLLVWGSPSTLVAQEASPVPSDEGVTIEPVASGVTDTLPSAPSLIQLYRIHVTPESSYSQPDGDPGTGVITAEAGEITVTLSDEATITHADGTTETLDADTETVLEVGDSILGPVGSGVTFRNDGFVEAVVLVVSVQPEDATPVSG
jgi:hypothetical protein